MLVWELDPKTEKDEEEEEEEEEEGVHRAAPQRRVPKGGSGGSGRSGGHSPHFLEAFFSPLNSGDFTPTPPRGRAKQGRLHRDSLLALLRLCQHLNAGDTNRPAVPPLQILGGGGRVMRCGVATYPELSPSVFSCRSPCFFLPACLSLCGFTRQVSPFLLPLAEEKKCGGEKTRQ